MLAQRTLSLNVLGCGVSIHCEHPEAWALLHANFSAMATSTVPPDLVYYVAADDHAFHVWRHHELVAHVHDLGALVYVVDSDIIVHLQLIRKDLLFIHGAVVTDAAGAHILTGRSGAGKSTTCWGLVRRGFDYLSDELAPICPADGMVQPFPRALCLKTASPDGSALPRGTHVTARGLHVPVSSLPGRNASRPSPVRTLLFVEYAAGRAKPTVRPIGPAEAAARLYPNILNALAHQDAAISGVSRVVSSARAFVVDAAELAATCDAIHSALPRNDHDAIARLTMGIVPVR